MMKQDELFCNMVSKELGIVRGSEEKGSQWKERVFYSALGRMAQASMWDKIEDGPISVEHFKSKIKKLVYAYKEINVGLSVAYSDSNQLADEIYRLYENTGLFYHEPFRIAPALPTISCSNGIFFLRNPNLNMPVNMSGLGFFTKINQDVTAESVIRHFALQESPLGSVWDYLLERAKWSTTELSGKIEYLRYKPPFSNGYWENEPVRDGTYSLLRVGEKGQQIYYLYYYEKGQCNISPIPDWRTKGSQYRNIANNYLARRGALPSIKYKETGSIVNIKLGYLLPPNELNFLELYSWPSRYADLPAPFNRTMQFEVFQAVKPVFQQIGYVFEKEI